MTIRNMLMAAAGVSTSGAASAQYWRASVIGGSYNNQIRISEIWFDDNPTGEGVLVADMVLQPFPNIGGSGEIRDKNLSSYALWSSEPSVGSPINISMQYTQPRAMKVLRVSITNQLAYSPTSIAVYNSVDNITWVPVKTFTGLTSWSSNETKTLTL